MSDTSEYTKKYAHLKKMTGKLAECSPGVMSAFGKLHSEALKDGALDQKTKELLALGIAISSRCEGCVTFHTHESMRAGATKEEVLETIGVAIMMGGGPALTYGGEALAALEEFLA